MNEWRGLGGGYPEAKPAISSSDYKAYNAKPEDQHQGGRVEILADTKQNQQHQRFVASNLKHTGTADIKRILVRVNMSKAAGQDNIHVCVQEICADY